MGRTAHRAFKHHPALKGQATDEGDHLRVAGEVLHAVLLRVQERGDPVAPRVEGVVGEDAGDRVAGRGRGVVEVHDLAVLIGEAQGGVVLMVAHGSVSVLEGGGQLSML